MDMVERAGRAVEKILWPHDSTPYASGGKAEAIARAVIEAMRESTDAMLTAGGYEFEACKALGPQQDDQ